LYRDQWLEYYDGKHGRLIGKEARSIKPGRSLLSSGKGINSNPDHLALVSFTEDPAMIACTLLG